MKAAKYGDEAAGLLRGSDDVPGGTSGARWLDASDFSGAEAAYAAIRAQDDVAAIAANTGMQPFHIRRIKDHLFVNAHVLDNGVRRFDADPLIANAWQRMQQARIRQRTCSCLDMNYSN